MKKIDCRGICRVLGALVFAALLTACSEKSVDDVIDAARSKAAVGDYPTALVELRSGMQLHPSSALMRLEFARVLVSAGDYSAAQIELRKLLPEKELLNQAVPILAKLLTQVGQFNQAITEFEGYQLDGGTARADLLATMALAHGALQRVDKARSLAEESLRLAPNNVSALLVLARLKAAESGPLAAIAIVDGALKIQPASADGWMLLGELLAAGATGAPPSLDAIAAFQKVVELAPNSLRAHSAIVGIYLARKDLPAATKAVEKMRKQLPTHPQTVFFQAQLASANGNFNRAAELTALVLKGLPNAVNALTFAGANELRRGGVVQAEGFLSKALSQAPDRLSIKRLLAATYLKSGQPAKAVELLKPIMQSEESKNDRETLLLFAEAHLLKGDHQSAEQYYQKALALAPNDASLRTTLALLGVSQGNLDQAVGELSAISDSDAEIVADKALVSTLLAHRDASRALAAIAKLDKKRPNSALVATLTGYALLLKADRSAARASFELALTRDPKFVTAAVALAGMDLKDGQIDKAIERHKALLTLDSKNLQSLIALAELNALSGAKKDEVVKLFESAIAAHPTEVLPRRLLVHYLIARNDFRGAAQVADVASASLPRSVELLETLAQAQLLSGNTNQALATLRRSIAINPNRAIAYIQLSTAQQVAGDQTGAEQSLRQAVVVEPRNVQARLNLVSIFLRQKSYPKALAIAKQMQKMLPEEAAADVLEGDVHVASGNLELALEAFRRGLERKNTVNAPARVHSTLLVMKKPDQAKKFAGEWRAKTPRDVAFIAYLGRRALERDDLPEAEALHREVVIMTAEPDAALLNNLAWVLVRTKSSDAVQFAKKAYDLAPKRAEIVDTYAQALSVSGRYTDAQKVLSDALITNQTSLPLKLALAKVYALSGDQSKAKELTLKLVSEIKTERDKKSLAEIKALLPS